MLMNGIVNKVDGLPEIKYSKHEVSGQNLKKTKTDGKYKDRNNNRPSRRKNKLRARRGFE
jgi:hypothetical protein